MPNITPGYYRIPEITPEYYYRIPENFKLKFPDPIIFPKHCTFTFKCEIDKCEIDKLEQIFGGNFNRYTALL